MSSPLKPCLTAECNVRHRLAGAYCTACNRDLLYSYRKGDKEGRMLAFIGLLD